MKAVVIVRRAVVRVISWRELKEGDRILWSSFACRVKAIDPEASPYRPNRGVCIELPDGSTTWIPMYQHFYMIEEVLDHD